MELRPRYTQTEIGSLPTEWELAALGKRGSFRKGCGVRKDQANSGDIPCVRYGELYTDHHEIIRKFPSRVSAEVASTARQLKKGDIVFAVSGETKGEIGKCAAFLEDFPAVAGGDTILFSPTWDDSRFLGYALNQPIAVRQKARRAQGDAVVHISARALQELVIPFPPPCEQRAIAGALADVDATIEAMTKMLAKKHALRTATMQRLLTGEVRLAGFTSNWQEKRIGDVAKVVRGASPRPIADPRWFDPNSSVGWVRISDVSRASMFLADTTQRLSEDGIARSRRVAMGSVIMSIAATVGRPTITKIDTCIHDGFVVFRKLKIDKFFLYYLLRYLEPRWSSRGQTGSQMNLNTGIIQREEIVIPADLQEQAAIARSFVDSDKEISSLGGRLAKMAALKQAMMQALLTGRVRLPVEATESDKQELEHA